MLVAGPAEAGKGIAMAGDPAVDGRAHPAKRRNDHQPAKPFPRGEFAQNRGPGEIADVPMAVRVARVHFGGENGLRERGFGGDGGIVVIGKFHAPLAVESSYTPLEAAAKRAGAVEIDSKIGVCGHR